MSESTQDVERVRRLQWEQLLKRSDAGQNDRLVGMMLATYADADGGSIHPGIERLRVDCDFCSEKTVRRHLQALRDLSLIQRVRRGSGRSGLADEYVLTAPAGTVHSLSHPDCVGRCDPRTYPNAGQWVYVIGALDGDTVKIGVSANPGRRLRSVQTGNEQRLHVLGVVPGERLDEAAVHDELAHYRLAGEWFALDADTAMAVLSSRVAIPA